ncbi:MAG: RT0821/Lpp0805 family surface protein [Proteobacteria bacterium]|nr:RT0821/Lpp0805 family surface protein [Pseudomonadota bacterium]MDA1071311.1 RT0821/Lpp0805 family surface protein [Pseudomonadota bacterium]
MTKLKFIALALAGALSLTACEGAGGKETAGTLLGAAGGALLGSQVGGGSGQILAAVAGGLAGAFLGNQIGSSLDKADQAYAEQATRQAQAAPVGQTISWNNPESGNSGTITPTRDGSDAAGNYCREYQTTVTVGGEVQKAYGTACQQPDGSWKVLN